MTHGLLAGQFHPAAGPARTARDDPRPRRMVSERANLVNRLQKTLESANIKLTCVATDMQGVSAR